MRVKVYDLDGTEEDETELPRVFDSDVRDDIIKRASEAHRAKSRRSHGSNPKAGFRTSAESWGAGRGVAMVPRIKNGRRAAIVPQAIGGRKAHPPKAEKDFSKKVNRKERRSAIRSAIAATARPDLVRARGHASVGPVVAVDGLESLDRTAEVRSFLKSVDLWADIERAKEGTRERSGKGKSRGRRKRKPKSVLFVVSVDRGVKRGARNLPGVDVSTVEDLGIEELAPGGNPGRLTVYTEGALEELR